MFDKIRSVVASSLKTFSAASDTLPDLQNRDMDEGWVGGYTGYNKENKYIYYQQLLDSDPFASSALRDLVTVLLSGLRFDGLDQALVEEFETWRSNIDLDNLLIDLGQSYFRDGTLVAAGGGDYDTFYVTPFLMEHVTVLPKGIKIGSTDAKTLVYPPVQVVLNEGDTTSKPIVFDINNIVYATFEKFRRKQKDNLGRMTHGLYGTSLLLPIERSIRYLTKTYEIYMDNLQHVGLSTYHFDFVGLEDAVKKKIKTRAEANAILDDYKKQYAKKTASTHIFTYGCNVENTTNGSAPLDPIKMIENLQRNIQVGLVSSELASGKSEGSTNAAGRVSEAARLRTLAGLRPSLFSIAQQIINLRLRLVGKEENSIWIEADPLSIEPLAARDLTEMINLGLAPREEAARRYNFKTQGVDDN